MSSLDKPFSSVLVKELSSKLNISGNKELSIFYFCSKALSIIELKIFNALVLVNYIVSFLSDYLNNCISYRALL